MRPLFVSLIILWSAICSYPQACAASTDTLRSKGAYIPRGWLFDYTTAPGAIPLWMQWAQYEIFKALSDNYIPLGHDAPVEYGPVMSTIGGNGLEGTRLQVGLITNSHFSRRLFLSGYGAYGFRDRRFKYMGRAEWSFVPKYYSAAEYPVRSIHLQYDYDVDMVGRRFVSPGSHDILLAIARHSDRMVTYRRRLFAGADYEPHRHWRFSTDVAWEREYPTEFMPFVDGSGREYQSYGRMRLDLSVAWTPGTYWRHEYHRRISLTPYAPVFTFHSTFSPSRLAGAPVPLVSSRLSFRKLWPIGTYASVWCVADLSHLWTGTFYPSLLYPPANGTYFVRRTSFAMMLPMEFACDTYGALFLESSPGLLPRVPALRRMGLREIVLLRGAMGRLSSRNDPSLHPHLLRFPAGVGQFRGALPYVECGLGLDRLLGFLRIEYVWRLTYRDHPGISRSGLAVGVDFSL